jgi:membrane protein DedA with SNARE-associated domain
LIDIQDLYYFYSGSGYLGIFLISFIGSIIPFIPVPYFPVLVTSALDKSLDPNLIVLISTVGAVLAKTIIFIASYYGRNILSTKTKTRMLPLQKVLSKYGGIGVFVAALTPIPDDLVYIPLGIAKYSPSKFALITFIGKYLLGTIIVWGTVYLGRPIMETFLVMTDSNDQYSAILITVLSIILLALVLFFTFRFDWAKIIGKWFPWAIDNSDTEFKHDTNDKKK